LPTAVGTAGDVLAIGIGQGSEKLHGFLDLTEIHTVIKDAL
jgi:alkaline phosphatase